MDQTEKLMNCVVENARMGLAAVEQLLTKTEDKALREELQRQREEYQTVSRDAEKYLYDAGGKPGKNDAMARVGLFMGTEFNTLLDKSPSHIVEMVIQGATMGVIETTKNQRELAEADAQAQGLATDFLNRQQAIIDRMKAFL